MKKKNKRGEIKKNHIPFAYVFNKFEIFSGITICSEQYILDKTIFSTKIFLSPSSFSNFGRLFFVCFSDLRLFEAKDVFLYAYTKQVAQPQSLTEENSICGIDRKELLINFSFFSFFSSFLYGFSAQTFLAICKLCFFKCKGKLPCSYVLFFLP